MKILIVCLRRSGSTIFWKTLRQDKRLTCYYEPFVDLLINLPKLNSKGTTHEYIQLVKKDPFTFWNMYSPIGFCEEISENMTPFQKCYLDFLLNSSQHVVCDLTRCCFKIKQLRDVAPDAYVIHLYRSPQAFVSSHILPNRPEAPTIRRFAVKIKKQMHKAVFWSVKFGYNGWGYEVIIGNSDYGLFSTYLKQNGLFVDGFNSLPAYGKLMYFWKICYEKVEHDGRLYYGDRFLSLAFEIFCQSPESCMKNIYKKIGLDLPRINYNNIRKSSMGFDPNNPNWKKMARKFGLDSIDEYPWREKFLSST